VYRSQGVYIPNDLVINLLENMCNGVFEGILFVSVKKTVVYFHDLSLLDRLVALSIRMGESLKFI